MKKKAIDITEKYGAVTQLKLIIEAFQKSNKDDVKLPGYEYLLERLANLYKDINMEIMQDFAGTINNLQSALKEMDKEEGDKDDRH